MFNRRKQDIEDLMAEIKCLRERICKVEQAVEPFRIGTFDLVRWSTSLWGGSKYYDLRPEVTHAHAIKLLLDHCGVEFKSVPESVVLEKKPKSDK